MSPAANGDLCPDAAIAEGVTACATTAVAEGVNAGANELPWALGVGLGDLR